MKPSIFSTMSALAKKHNAINLSQGFPDFKSDPILLNLVTQALNDGYNQYAPMAGAIELREAVSSKVEALYQSKYNPESEITITAGATQAIFVCIAAVIKPGDEVIIFTPAYDCYEPTIRLFGGKVIPIQLKALSYNIPWEEVNEKCTPKTKLIIINTPHNPTGTVLKMNDMVQLERVVLKTNCYILSDEVYEHIVFDANKHLSVAAFPAIAQQSFIVASFGKTFHNTGWKIGYCLAPKLLTDAFRNIHQYNVFCVNHPMQKALALYLKDEENYLGLGKFYQLKRDFFLNLIKDLPFSFTPSSGTYFQLLNIDSITNETDVDFAVRATKDFKIAMIPTSVFNTNSKDFRQVRVCFAKEEETLEKAAFNLMKLTKS